MKQKLNKKLTLNKVTVSNLGNGEMKNVMGGAHTDEICPTWFFTCDQETCKGNC